MKFLVFQHVPHEHPGLISEFARDKNIELRIIEFFKPYNIPDISKYDALIIMGGPMGVYEDKETFPSKDEEAKVIKKAIKNNLPVIGFCLGSQLIAYALGAKVYPNIKNGKKIKEIGYYDVNLTEAGKVDPIFKDFDSLIKVFQWHGDGFDLPNEATLLATSQRCINQAFRYGKNVYAMLFHNEFTIEMVKKQIEIDNKWIHQDFNFDEALVIKQAYQYSTLMKNQCKQLLNNFILTFAN